MTTRARHLPVIGRFYRASARFSAQADLMKQTDNLARRTNHAHATLCFNPHKSTSSVSRQYCTPLKENERKLRIDGVNCLEEMLLAAGCENVQVHNQPTAPGAAIHEMGTARMGRGPGTSGLNKWNQVHTVPNVFVTDGSFITSAGTQNPSITYMAFTARAVDYLSKEMKRDGVI